MVPDIAQYCSLDGKVEGQRCQVARGTRDELKTYDAFGGNNCGSPESVEWSGLATSDSSQRTGKNRI